MILLWSKISDDCRFILYGVYLSEEEEWKCKLMVTSDITLPLSFYFYRSNINKHKSVFLLLSVTHLILLPVSCIGSSSFKDCNSAFPPLMVTCKILIVLFPEAELRETREKISNMSNSYKQNQFNWKRNVQIHCHQQNAMEKKLCSLECCEILCTRHILRWMQTWSHS